MSSAIHQRLFEHARPFRTGEFGPSLEDVGRIPIVPALINDLAAALDSNDLTDQKVGLFFCEGLLLLVPQDSELAKVVAPRIERLTHSGDELVRSVAVPAFIHLRQQVPAYRERMLEFVKDLAPSVRNAALCASQTFLSTGEVLPLISFQNDHYVSETGGMGGPWRYVLRDEALCRIEAALGRSFRKHELSESQNGQVIFWWDWAPFLEWWSKRNRPWRKLFAA